MRRTRMSVRPPEVTDPSTISTTRRCLAARRPERLLYGPLLAVKEYSRFDAHAKEADPAPLQTRQSRREPSFLLVASISRNAAPAHAFL